MVIPLVPVIVSQNPYIPYLRAPRFWDPVQGTVSCRYERQSAQSRRRSSPAAVGCSLQRSAGPFAYRSRGLLCLLCAGEVDMMVLGAISAIASTVNNVSGLYGGRKVFPNFFAYMVAPASAGKGRLALIRSLVQPIHDQLREQNKLEWERYYEELVQYKQAKDPDMEKPVPPPLRMHIIPANTSATAMCKILYDNGGVGL